MCVTCVKSNRSKTNECLNDKLKALNAETAFGRPSEERTRLILFVCEYKCRVRLRWMVKSMNALPRGTDGRKTNVVLNAREIRYKATLTFDFCLCYRKNALKIGLSIFQRHRSVSSSNSMLNNVIILRVARIYKRLDNNHKSQSFGRAVIYTHSCELVNLHNVLHCSRIKRKPYSSDFIICVNIFG